MITLLAALALSSVHAQPVKFRKYKYPVMVWVPPYGVARSQTALATPGVAEGITHLALQFWVPTPDGQAALDTPESEVTDQSIADLVNWGHKNGIRVILTVFNGENKWDWSLAKDGFSANPDKFLASLVDQVKKYNLDGVDIDLEGDGDFDADKTAYVSFIGKLSKALHRQRKQLTLDAFCSKWNAPNTTWWPDLFPFVDALTTMGYDGIGINGKDWGAYSYQVAAAGKYIGKLQMGVPGWKDNWKGNSVVEQLTWIKQQAHSGIGIWDAQLQAPGWKSDAVWSLVAQIAAGK